MNTEDIIRMAREAGWEDLSDDDISDGLFVARFKYLERFAAIVAAASAIEERDACARLCERGDPRRKPRLTQHQCATAIRARGWQ